MDLWDTDYIDLCGPGHIQFDRDGGQIAGSGFRIEAMANARLPGPRTHTFLYEGRARPA